MVYPPVPVHSREREKTRRKPYSKPDVECVPLTPEETLSTNCKTEDFPGNGAGNENNCLIDGCLEFGS
jgi:hypothetical protein